MLNNIISESVKHFPSKTAIIDSNNKISYKELDIKINKLADLLLSININYQERIGILIEKSINAVIAILSILNVSSCYVPLDTQTPFDRLKKIIDDCSIRILILSKNKFDEIQNVLKNIKSLKTCIIIDEAANENYINLKNYFQIYSYKDFFLKKTWKKKNNKIKPPVQASLAYILYTSGSTGDPKGVMISHKAAMSFINWACKTFQVNDSDIISSHAPFHFDLSIFDIFVSLKIGCTLVLVPQGLSFFPKSLKNFIEQYKITIWYSVPSVLIQLAIYGNISADSFPSLRTILFAGEVFPIKYLRMLMKKIKHVKYYNLFGPTETNVCTYYHVKKIPRLDESIPIGIPCEGTEAYIINKNGNLASIGEKGELYVSGPTLMSGYWNDKQKTESILLENPFSNKYKIFYKTGDIVSRNKNNILDFHGRNDQMIKCRGYRIECGDVESVIIQHKKIKEVAVVGKSHEEYGKVIVSFISTSPITSKKQKEELVNQLFIYCKRNLPPYMMPYKIIILDSIPRTSTNKIDRKKLEIIAEEL